MMTYKKIHKTKKQWREEDSTGIKMNRERQKTNEAQRQEKDLGGIDVIEKRRTTEEELHKQGRNLRKKIEETDD